MRSIFSDVLIETHVYKELMVIAALQMAAISEQFKMIDEVMGGSPGQASLQQEAGASNAALRWARHLILHR
jgi:hypothetical protein